jgi:hypothetical protein
MSPEKFPDAVARTESLHALYEKSTGFKYRLDYSRIRAWHDYVQAGFSETDLALVIGYLRKKIAAGDRNVGALKFGNLITALDKFEDDLNVAIHESRIRRGGKPPTVQTTQQVGNVSRVIETPRPTEDDAIDVGKIFEGIRENITTGGRSSV